MRLFFLLWGMANSTASEWFEVLAINPDLKNFLSRTIPQSLAVQATIWGWRNTKDNSNIAKSAYFPSVRLSSEFNSNWEHFKKNSYDWQTRLIFSYNIFDGGITRANYKIAKYALQVAKDQITKKFQDTLQEVLLLWIDYKFALKKNLAYKRVMANLEKDYEVSKNRFSHGQTSISDVQNALSSLENYRTRLIQSDNEIVSLQIKLTTILGEDFPYEFEALNFNLEKFAQISLKDFFKFALQNNIDLLLARSFQKLAELQIRLELAKTQPQIAFSCGPQVNFSGNNQKVEFVPSNFGLSLSYDVYNSGTKSANVRQKYSDFAQSNLDYGQKVQKVNEDILNFVNTVKSDIKAITNADKSLVALENVLKAARAKYEVGSESMVIILDQEEKWFEQFLVVLEIEKDIEKNILNLIFISGKIDLNIFGWQELVNCLDNEFFNNAGSFDFKDIEKTTEYYRLDAKSQAV